MEGQQQPQPKKEIKYRIGMKTGSIRFDDAGHPIPQNRASWFSRSIATIMQVSRMILHMDIWKPVPFISERATFRVMWITTAVAFILFLILVSALSSV
jgi:hypothetical protein